MIDFVVTWVDGNDPVWKNERKKYDTSFEVDASEERFRDWGLMKYWFRAVEKNCPWVNKIYFITCGHVPEWLNLDNPKLVHIKHSDYISQEDLPTFNSNSIEVNIHRIKDLSENFVLFNDDMFVLKPMKKEDFFINGIPRDSFSENCITIGAKNDIFPHILLNNMAIINSKFSKRKTYLKYPFKFLNLKYGLKNFRTLCFLGWSNYAGIYDTHLPVALCKSTIDTVWKENFEQLKCTSHNRFRSINDMSQYTFRFYQMLSGNFIPRSFHYGKRVSLNNDTKNNSKIFNYIKNQKYKMICINDGKIDDFFSLKNELISSFEKILPDKSSFEK